MKFFQKFLFWVPLGILCLVFHACLQVPSLSLHPDDLQSGGHSLPPPVEGTFQIYFPYVGQGDAGLMIFPNGKTLLIDAGPPGAGAKYLLPLLRELNIDRLDALLVSHYDADHLGGIPSLLQGEDGIWKTADDIAVGQAYDRGGEPMDFSPEYLPYLEALQQKAVPRRRLAAGQEMLLDDSVEIRCLAAGAEVLSPRGDVISIDLSPNTYTSKENAASIALSFRFGDFKYFTAGDLTGGGMLNGFLSPDIETLVAKTLGRVDVLHVNHHGSATSSNAAFVAATSPEAVMIQAGKNNPYGHPNAEVVERWKNIGSRIYTTQEGVGFVLTSEGSGVEIR
ncbi:MAG TPA: hypothetical protein DF383_00560 [Deltaproteobacteria bacterium]|nr:hypothetical protein [Deltaproteobacteria bacterium]